MSVSFHGGSTSLGIRHVWDDYGPGGHTWPYWQRDLRETLPELMAGFRRPAAAPARVTFRAIEPRYGVYGWRVAVRRPALEFSELRGASRRGFTLRGSGTARVVTPPDVRAGRAAARARARPPRDARRSCWPPIAPGGCGSAVALGPGNRGQQDAAGHQRRACSAPRCGCGRRRAVGDHARGSRRRRS